VFQPLAVPGGVVPWYRLLVPFQDDNCVPSATPDGGWQPAWARPAGQ